MKKYHPKRKINYLLISLFIIIVLVLLAQKTVLKTGINIPPRNDNIRSNEQPEINPQDNKVLQNKITIDYGGGRKKSFQVAAANAYEALAIAAEKDGIKLESKEYKYGLIVESVNGVKNTNDKYWIFSVNGKPGQISADRTVISPGDAVIWEYVRSK
ncbi:hypothetical protein A3D05_02565 [Candidatus Gottesmanbacteria bacterium RIFCSPHIGHO2_02_FULL_40_24]|uniref:Transcobalamin-like C-terminal domain-containing protein n=1 Tax=Candidatus Gottesmanbacteria bacterium RIFCSPHIGHO2_01_FULL_40_15 TaxID=1798376 RepID=A0A1F5Z627_9BACT|nr:MAG: hypothetical protein A2777_00570 [Candidatus Gottesmanbacteria bacterium RIFCSPHIGHO2_01_FULL_40_15]OGG18733.1 MAG: hypothetical protein A3D05_02565 [Candidatus Gottesmanbacteria bacterium RIFCSPHIGHO2_02_FULL_40_24]OGG20914.1 MAG: hypothetical protein A3B48_05940 [Candidatus Gottesmanbacteria bacterium RIFCSPLOWO2_01_FULL_40_10]OGG23024.1 MAG: hypothetical protein A3E42_06775 [Candidatus Gottesmanbacteria bacterium RIFCSPHIGHO2_12_FULL_40_13]OGG32110.1 MAG: hypothetical protein A3I80_0